MDTTVPLEGHVQTVSLASDEAAEAGNRDDARERDVLEVVGHDAARSILCSQILWPHIARLALVRVFFRTLPCQQAHRTEMNVGIEGLRSARDRRHVYTANWRGIKRDTSN